MKEAPMNKKRSIFEEVGDNAAAPVTPQGGLIDAGRKTARRGIALWLLGLFFLVAAMVVVGGLTRLTDSGLSITEWKPVTGALPPMGDAAWTTEFGKYQTSPEYQLQNKGMSLAEFKAIFWWEWGHRQLGRFVGLFWAVGFFGFLLVRKIPTGWTGRLFGVGALGGLQGAVGWWMVSSGLTGRMVDVASYRLAIHLTLAFIIFCVILWFVWLLRREERDLMQARRQRDTALQGWAGLLLLLVFFQIILGALVAGIDAGRGYIDWPLMNGQFLPSESLDYQPLWTNFFENPALVQFNHRMIGYLVAVVGSFIWWKSRKNPRVATKAAFSGVMVMIVIQAVLGIVTVLYAAPWQVAIVHQIGAIVLVAAILRARFTAMYPKTQSLR
jgi:heme a synthase